jgi:hypothetical protein
MATAEDVYYLYERNSFYHNNCSKQGRIHNCPTLWLHECYCYTSQNVQPITIGNQSVPCSINRKCYVKAGEECPICLEIILRKSDTYLTCCGHSYHKSCIFKAMESRYNEKYIGLFKCPICRTNLGLDLHEINIKYKFGENHLDNLENFWLNKDFTVIQKCMNRYDHDLGMKNDCKYCLDYRKNGSIL